VTTKTDWFVLDLETTGLRPEAGDLICEVGMSAVDDKLKIQGSINLIVTKDDQITKLRESDFALAMHVKSGLLAEMEEYSTLPTEGNDWVFSHASADDALSDFLDFHSVEGAKVLLIGSSIHFDRGFIKQYLPKVESRLHYRMIDVSSIKELARKWTPRIESTLPVPARSHRSMPDIMDTLSELNGYMNLFSFWNEYMDGLDERTLSLVHEVLDERKPESDPDDGRMSRWNCSVCGKPIIVSIFKGTGVCSIICRKKRDGDPPKVYY